MKRILLIFLIILNLNALIISSFHNHIHKSKFENCLILNYQNNSNIEIKEFKIEFEKPKILFQLSFNFKQNYKSQIIPIYPNARSPPIITLI
ncbi:MAG: hypothetical protein ABIL76_05175 [candidate division WOR-3 bacterium]